MPAQMTQATPSTGRASENGAHPLRRADGSLPSDPTALVLEWFEAAARVGRDREFNAMTLATCTRDGVPSARIVICQDIEPDPLSVLFFTDLQSRKASELADNPRAAAVLFWPRLHRQIRVEGVVERLTEEENDACFSALPTLEKVGAACVARRRREGGLVRQARSIATDVLKGTHRRRPPTWSGCRLHALAVELWCAPEGMMHTRTRWTRAACAPEGAGTHIAAGWQVDPLVS